MDEDDGVLGRLPRSRPGTRSEKREGQAERAGVARTPGARPKASRAKPTSAPRAASPKQPPSPEPRAADPVGHVVRTAGQVAGAGVRVAGTLAQELLRRLPRR